MKSRVWHVDQDAALQSKLVLLSINLCSALREKADPGQTLAGNVWQEERLDELGVSAINTGNGAVDYVPELTGISTSCRQATTFCKRPKRMQKAT